MNKLNDFFNSPNREKLLKEVARKSNEDQLAYSKYDTEGFEDDEGYPNFYDYSFNWKWKLFFWAIFLIPIVGVLAIATLIVRYF